MSEATDHTRGVADGLRMAADWLRRQEQWYPEDVFTPPPPHDELTAEQKSYITIGAAGMARHVCRVWSRALIEDYSGQEEPDDA